MPSGVNDVKHITGYYKNKQCRLKATVKWPLIEILNSSRHSYDLQNEPCLGFKIEHQVVCYCPILFKWSRVICQRSTSNGL